MTFTIPHRLPGLNEVIAANRSHPKAGNALKQKAQALITPYLPPVSIDGRQDYAFTWYCANGKRDPDNIASAVKFILDAMVAAGTIGNDGWANVGSITHTFVRATTDAVEVSLCPSALTPPAPPS